MRTIRYLVKQTEITANIMRKNNHKMTLNVGNTFII